MKTVLSRQDLMAKHLASFMTMYDSFGGCEGFQTEGNIDNYVSLFEFEAGEEKGKEWAPEFRTILEIYVKAMKRSGAPSRRLDGIDPSQLGVVGEKNRAHDFGLRVLAKLRGIFGS